MTLDLAAIRALCAEATPGPWNRRELACDVGPVTDMEIASTGSNATSADLNFIAAARTALPQALNEIDQLRLALGEALDKWDPEVEDDDAPRIAELRKLVTP